MRTLLLTLLLLTNGLGVRAVPRTERCFYEGERSAGLNKICYYHCPSGPAAITIRAVQLCPLSIDR